MKISMKVNCEGNKNEKKKNYVDKKDARQLYFQENYKENKYDKWQYYEENIDAKRQYYVENKDAKRQYYVENKDDKRQYYVENKMLQGNTM